MHDTLVGRISRRLLLSGVSSTNSIIGSVALATAWFEDRSATNPQALFQAMADRIEPDAPGLSGLKVAAGWLRSPSLTSIQWDALSAALDELQSGFHGPVDWTAEFTSSFGDSRMGPQLGPSLPIARALNRVLDIPLSDRVVCLFDGAATMAWALSGERDVALILTNHDTAIATALIARAACRTLEISFAPQLVDVLSQPSQSDLSATLKRYDHIVTVPPFGMRAREGDARGMPFETLQILQLAPRANSTFWTIVPDGVLFRESRQEILARQSMVESNTTTVMSLPNGMFMPSSNLSSSLLRLEPGRISGTATMISARSLEKGASGRATEQAIARHLEQYQGMHARDAERARVVSLEDLAANTFSLLPERYVKSEGLDLIDNALRDWPSVTLEDIATIERSKAPLPLREGDEEGALYALEIAPSDIVEGVVREPKRRLAFDASQQGALAKVAIKPDDILVSIKGNVGIVGHVNIEADLAIMFEEPWIVSQSLAIIRLKPDSPIGSSEVLATMLTAPWVREKLESMSGGTTVRSLPISAIRSLSIPLPTPEQVAEASDQLTAVGQLRYNARKIHEKIDAMRHWLWQSLWHIDPETGDE